MTSAKLRHLSWRASSYSGNTGNCVEIAALLAEARAVRDTKDRDGGVLILDASAWTTFLAASKQGAMTEQRLQWSSALPAGQQQTGEVITLHNWAAKSARVVRRLAPERLLATKPPIKVRSRPNMSLSQNVQRPV